MKLPKLNVKLLNRIKRHLAREPRRYDQAYWGVKVDKEVSPCGTQGCIAGWAVFLTTPKERWARWITKAYDGSDSFRNKAIKLLGLTEIESIVLFSPNNQRANRDKEGVRSAEKKIDALIADRVEFAKGERSW